eukprot:2010634-Lingulodinium_polyedra.AAC.1
MRVPRGDHAPAITADHYAAGWRGRIVFAAMAPAVLRPRSRPPRSGGMPLPPPEPCPWPL